MIKLFRKVARNFRIFKQALGIRYLISSDNTYQPISLLAGLYDTYYKAHGLDGLKAMLASVIERGEDPMRERRIAALMKTGLTGGSAAENIVRHLCEILKRK